MDWTVIVWPLLIASIIIGIYAQIRVTGAFRRYSQVPIDSGLSGAEVAERILGRAGIQDVSVERTESFLGDHYDPRAKKLCLSPGVYDGRSISAVGVAAHECGHALQHQHGYAPLQFRMAIVPPTMFCMQLLPLVMIGGIWFHIMGLIYLGILVYGALTFFQLVTLPVEFNASNRAKEILWQMGVVTHEEASGVNKVLNAAALTYVAALISAAANLLWMIAEAQRRR